MRGRLDKGSKVWPLVRGKVQEDQILRAMERISSLLDALSP